MITLQVNKFLAALTNLIAYAQTLDTINTGTISRLVDSCQDITCENGSGKVVFAVDTMAVNDTDYDTSSLLTSVKPTVNEQYLPVTDYKNIHLTINEYLTRGAFVEETAMAGFVGYVRGVMEKSKQIFLYKMIIGMYEGYTPVNAEQTIIISLKDTTTITSEADLLAAQTYNTNKLYNALIDILTELTAPSNKYNDLSYTECYNPGDLKLVVNSHFNNQMLVNTLATLLNSDKITDAMKWAETIIIPKSQLQDGNQETVLGWLTDKKKIQFGYYFNVATSFFDASTLNQQDFLHFAYYKGIVNGLPAVKFTVEYV